MGQQIEKLAQFVAETQWEDIPESVQRHAKLVLLDTLGVILAGSVRPEVRQLRERLAPTAGTGATVYARGWPAHDPRTAALLNGIAGRAIELCEGLRLVTGQAAMQVLPGVLAVGEPARSTGRDMMTALILGYDVAGPAWSGIHPAAARASERSGDAAGSGCRRRAPARSRRSADEPRHAHRDDAPADAELHQRGRRRDDAQCRRRHERLCRRARARAGARGVRSAGRCDRGSAGQSRGSGFKPENLLDELGTRWEITRNYFRLYACCNPIHPALDCLHAIIAELRPRAEEIERIDVATYRFASVMRNPDPPNYFASKYSLPHAAAVMVVKGNAGHGAIDDAALHDPAIAALRHRVHVTEDPAMSAVAPRLRPARVTVTLKDGRQSTHARESHRGDFNQPFEESELREKFHELAGLVLTPEGVTRIEDAVNDGERWTSVRELSAQLRCYAR